MSSAPIARPVDEKEANRPVIKAWKDIKWKLQPESYNVRKLMIKALEKAVDSSELPCMSLCEHCQSIYSLPGQANEHDTLEAKGWLKDLFDEETYEKVSDFGILKIQVY
jgi:hypothetical protein